MNEINKLTDLVDRSTAVEALGKSISVVFELAVDVTRQVAVNR